MNKPVKTWLMFTLRWGIAVAGIAFVVRALHFHDRVKVLTPANRLVDVQVIGNPPEDAAAFPVWGAFGDEPAAEHVVPRADVWTRPNLKSVEIRRGDAGKHMVPLVAIRPASSAGGQPVPAKLLVEDPATKANVVVDPSDVVDAKYQVPQYPLIEIGLTRMVHQANPWFLLAAIAVLPLSYLLTSYRWHILLEAMEIHVGQSRAFVLNMVGAFYNTFMPGSTGGDVIKAYYAAKHTDHRTRAVMSVLVDRLIGLLALVMLGGTMAALQYHRSPECRRVAKASGLLLAITAIGLLVFYHRGLRRATGLAWLLRRLPMQRFVHNAVHAMELYGRRPGRMLFALCLCFPVHMTSILSATLAGEAFGLPLSPMYYWVIVPVIALVGALPISPQGAGVMEFFAIQLTKYHHVSVGQAVALVMCIRLTAMFWNLVAGLFVLRGGYHAPTEAEANELEADDEDDSDEPNPAPAHSDLPTRPLATIEPLARG